MTEPREIADPIGFLASTARPRAIPWSPLRPS